MPGSSADADAAADPRLATAPTGRRRMLQALAGAAALVGPARSAVAAAAVDPGDGQTDDPGDAIRPGRDLRFPRDHGAHPGAGIEWWYATGWLQAGGGALIGFQLTFFRSRLARPVAAPAERPPGRFEPRQLLFAHAAVSDLAAGRHRHAQRLARWSGDERLPEAHARRSDTALTLGPWRLQREDLRGVSRYLARLAAPEAGFTLDLQLTSSQPVLLQGDAGYSRKGPSPGQASLYYSQPQLAVRAELTLDGRRRQLDGRGWLDHEWSDTLLAPGAVGWDWIGINLADGGALTLFQLRRGDGSALWAGGSHRPAGGPPRDFGPEALRWEAGRRWTSPSTGARYPVQWTVFTPAGRFEVAALLDAQELDSRASTGAMYWEGLVELRDEAGRRVGLGYLEMTGRAAPLRLGF